MYKTILRIGLLVGIALAVPSVGNAQSYWGTATTDAFGTTYYSGSYGQSLGTTTRDAFGTTYYSGW